MWVRNFWHMLVSNMGNTPGSCLRASSSHPPCLLMSKIIVQEDVSSGHISACTCDTYNPATIQIKLPFLPFSIETSFLSIKPNLWSLEAVLRPFTSSAIQSQALWGQSGPSTVGPSSNFLRNQPLYVMIHPENQKGRRKIAQALTPDSKRYFLVATKRPFFATAYT